MMHHFRVFGRCYLFNVKGYNGAKERVAGGVVDNIGLASEGVRVVWSSGLVDRPYDRIYIRTITMYRCMDRLSQYIPFSYQT